jgi:hypothetical protein
LINAGLAGSFALTYVLVDLGTDEVRTAGGEVVGELSLRQWQLIGTYATGVTDALRAGVNVKLFNAGTCARARARERNRPALHTCSISVFKPGCRECHPWKLALR